MVIDREILELLEHNAKIAPAQIAAMLGVDEDQVAAAINRLEKERVILEYSVAIDWEKMGDTTVEALIEVKAVPQRDRGFNHIAQRIAAFEEVHDVYLMSGAYDLLVMINGTTVREVAQFVSEKLAPMDSVLSTATHFVLKKYKLNGVLFGGNGDDSRLMVTP